MKRLILLLVLMMGSVILFGHGKEIHNNEKPDQEVSNSETSDIKNDQQQVNRHQMRLDQINLSYQKNVKPIFEKKCFDCHGTIIDFPWYYKVPGIKQLMDLDIKEAKEHLNMTNDFPFGGHGTPASDLESIKKSIENGTMPIFMYRLTHPDSKLTKPEQEVVFQWIDEAIKNLEIK